MLGPGVDRGQVEGERVEPPALRRRLRGREVAVPGLVGGAGEGDVEADFDDPVIGPEHRLADGDEPGMGGDVDEAADPLGMDLDIPALRPARQGAAGHALRLLEQPADILPHPLDPGPREGALEGDDAVAVEAAHDGAGVVILLFDFRRRRHPDHPTPEAIYELIHLSDECEAANRPPMSENAQFAFEVEAAEDGEGTRFEVRAAGRPEIRTYRLPGGEQADYAGFFRRLADDWGTRIPHAFAEPGRGARGRGRVAAFAHRQYLAPDPRRLWRSRRAQDGRGLCPRRHLERRARRLPDPALRRPRTLGACRLRLSRGPGAGLDGERAPGRRFLGAGNGAGRRRILARLHRPQDLERPRHRPRQKRQPVRPVARSRPAPHRRPRAQHDRRSGRSGQAAAERRGHRLAHPHRRGRRALSCSGRRTRTESGRARSPACCARGRS